MNRIYGFLMLALLIPLIAGFYFSGRSEAPVDETKTMSEADELACRRAIRRQLGGAIRAAENDLVITRYLEMRCSSDAGGGPLVKIIRHEVIASFQGHFRPGDIIEWRSPVRESERNAALMVFFSTDELNTANFMEIPADLQPDASRLPKRYFMAESYAPATPAVKVPSERANIAFSTFFALKEDRELLK